MPTENDQATLEFIKRAGDRLSLVDVEWEDGTPVVAIVATAPLTAGHTAMIPLAILVTEDAATTFFHKLRPPAADAQGRTVRKAFGTFDPNQNLLIEDPDP